MNPPTPGSASAVFTALGQGLPLLLLHFAAAVILLAVGAAIYMAITPFRERELLASGNTAAATVLAGTLLALAIPLAALLATSGAVLDILAWGVVALVIQLLTFGLMAMLLGHLRVLIEAGNVAVAMVLAAAQIAVALLNAAVMVPN